MNWYNVNDFANLLVFLYDYNLIDLHLFFSCHLFFFKFSSSSGISMYYIIGDLYLTLCPIFCLMSSSSPLFFFIGYLFIIPQV
jgi:hypothetical protein